MPRPPVLGYLQSAVADNTAHSQMDKLLFEDEMSNIQPEWGTMREEQEGYDPAKAIAEGDFTLLGTTSKAWRELEKFLPKPRLRKYKKWIREEASTPIEPKTLDELRRVIEQRTGALKGGAQLFEQGKPYSDIYKGTIVPSNIGRSRKFGSKKINPPIPERQKVGFQQGGPAERAPLLGYMNPVFNPEGSGYDMETALDAGLTRDEIGHMGSLDPRTGMVLKGKSHESWNPMVQKEMSLGNTVEYDPDKGRYFSVEGGMYNPAIQDETAHSQMDRLMFENELEQQPQHSMRTYQQGYDPAMEWGEGMMPIGGALRLLKGSKEWPDLLKVMAQSSLRDKRKMEVMNHARNIFGKKMDAGGADEATRQYLESKWMERVIQ